MGFQKFGTSNDQKVLSDEKDTQGVSKTAEKRVDFTENDRAELRKETENK